MDLTVEGFVYVDWTHVAQVESSDELLWTWYWTFGFHKGRGVSWQSKRLPASQKRLCYSLFDL